MAEIQQKVDKDKVQRIKDELEQVGEGAAWAEIAGTCSVMGLASGTLCELPSEG